MSTVLGGLGLSGVDGAGHASGWLAHRAHNGAALTTRRCDGAAVEIVAPVRLDATQLTDQQLQKNSTERIREVLDRLRGIEPPKPEPDDPDKLN